MGCEFAVGAGGPAGVGVPEDGVAGLGLWGL